MGRRSAPFSTDLTRLKVVANTNRIGSTIASGVNWSKSIEILTTIRISHIYMLISTEDARALAQAVDRAHRKAVGFTCSCRGIETSCMSFGHPALRYQGGVAQPVLPTREPDIAVAAGILLHHFRE